MLPVRRRLNHEFVLVERLLDLLVVLWNFASVAGLLVLALLAFIRTITLTIMIMVTIL